MKMLCNLCCVKTRLNRVNNQRHSSLNLVSRQLKLCNIYFRNGVSNTHYKNFRDWRFTIINSLQKNELFKSFRDQHGYTVRGGGGGASPLEDFLPTKFNPKQ